MSEGGRNRRGEGPTVGDSLGRGRNARKDWLEPCTQADDKLKRVRWEGENECVEVETERRRGKEGVRAARCPVIMTGLCGCAEEKRRLVFLFLLVMVFFRRAAARHRKTRRNGLNAFVKGKEDAPEL